MSIFEGKTREEISRMFMGLKKSSFELIKKLDLNHFSHLFLDKFDEKAVLDYLDLTGYNTFSIRDTANVNSKITAQFLTRDEVLEKCRGYENFSIMGYMKEWTNKLILCGEIELKTANGDFELNLIASTDPCGHVRGAVQKPTHVINGELYNRRLEDALCKIEGTDTIISRNTKLKHIADRVQGLSYTIDYLCKNNLANIITEFSLYKVPVGVKNEHMMVTELRTLY